MKPREAFTVYIAASWKHEHAVRMLTDLLRDEHIRVLSFVENTEETEDLVRNPKRITTDEWIDGKRGRSKFQFDVESATMADVVVYVGPSGTDAWAEVGAAWAAGRAIVGLYAKGEPSGLMRHMVHWFHNHKDLIQKVCEYRNKERESENVKGA